MCSLLSQLSIGYPLAAYDPRPQPWSEWQRQLPLNGWELLLFVLLAGLVLYIVIRRREGTPAQKTSVELLKQRYARGEITQDQFYQMKKDIERQGRA
jgi:putative membrane protein